MGDAGDNDNVDDGAPQARAPQTMERIVPDEVGHGGGVTGSEAVRLHLERYAFAADHARPGRLLDIACGVGYGTAHLAEARPDITELVGVDLAESAVDYARCRYAAGCNRLRYVCHDALTFVDRAGFDSIVSLETIEHVPDAPSLVRNLVRQLRPGGVMIASVPVTPSTDANPHHLHDFTPASFRRLFAGLGLEEVAQLSQVQPFSVGSVVARTEPRMRQMRRNLLGYYLTHPASAWRRAWSTLIDGFNNRYLTVAWRRTA